MTNWRGKRASTPPADLRHRWYFSDWATYRGKRQADAERELGWPRAKTSDLWNGKQRYTQETIDQVAQWLELEPYELLMPPDEAMSIRQLRQAARAIVASDAPTMTSERVRPFSDPSPVARKRPRQLDTPGSLR